MNVGALLTSAGVNVGICAVLLSFYSILRKQPSNVNVYFGRRLAQERIGREDCFCFERLYPSASWIVKAWKISEDEVLALGGLDAVVFFRIVVFSIRIFSIAAILGLLLVLPLNYYGQDMRHNKISLESLDVFTIANVKTGSEWLWAHCLALYIITFSACILLYYEYRSIAKLRLEHITRAYTNPSHFAILVRSIPWSPEESYSYSVRKFFTSYHASTYLSPQMIYRSGTVHKIMDGAGSVYRTLSKYKPSSAHHILEPCLMRCNFCGGTTNYFNVLSNEPDHFGDKPALARTDSDKREKETAAAFVFFKTRYAAFAAANVLQSSNPMLWVTDMAPEPNDVYWSNLWIPYKQLWIRKLAIFVATAVFMMFFVAPVAAAQTMSQLDKLQRILPFMKGILKNEIVNRLVTGYLPSVVLMVFLYTVPPIMMLFSAAEGTISRSGRKMSACRRILYFTIFNVFFLTVLTGSFLRRVYSLPSPRDIPNQLATAVPMQATFFTTYVLTSGWTSLSTELIQLYGLFCNLFYRFFLCSKENPGSFVFSFPYYTEVPRLLLFGLLGFAYAVLAPLMLPFLLIYFSMSYVVYRNQFVNVYIMKYDGGGKLWPIAHNTTIFSLVVAQIIALSVFGLKESPLALGLTVPLVILTLLFNEYCRQRFYPIFKSISAQDLIEMDRQDEISGRMEEIYEQLETAYYQYSDYPTAMCESHASSHCSFVDAIQPRNDLMMPRMAYPTSGRVPLSGGARQATWLSMSLTSQELKLPT